ncbi:MATE family efflux transporter [Laceyella putida]|uniref:MATE family efflux transporter n=1 Tax=Laceyella putida TaxID=110101 RepID=A0ABW2RMW8_9BACL
MAVSGMGAVNSILVLIMMPVFGISQGVQPIIGFNYGAAKFDRVKEALKSGMIFASAITALGFVAAMVYPGPMMSIFTEDKAFVAFGTHAMGIIMMLLPVLGFQIVGSGYFQAVGKPKQAMFLTLSKQVLFLIPALLVLPLFFKMMGLLVAVPLSDLLATVMTAIWLVPELKNLNKKQREALAQVEMK